jgi:DNA-directed RNA polymerase specialized sigma24 family protein
MQGLSYQEIAEATGLGVDVVRTRLARARGMLRRRLEGLV